MKNSKNRKKRIGKISGKIIGTGVILGLLMVMSPSYIASAMMENTPMTVEELPEGTVEETSTPEGDEWEDGEWYDQWEFENARFTDQNITYAKNLTYQLTLDGLEEVTTQYTLSYISSDSSIASVEQNGLVRTYKAGNVVITCTLTTASGKQYDYTCHFRVTEPAFSKQTYVITTGKYLMLQVIGTDSPLKNLVNSNPEFVSVDWYYGVVVNGFVAGKSRITAEVDGTTISCEVIVSVPKVKDHMIFMTRGTTYNLTVSGQSKTTGITYRSSNTKVVTVNSKGQLKALKNGSAFITISVDNTSLVVHVGVGKTGVVSALNRAKAALGAKYSQPKRMKPGYYDCSSLVWRSYSPSKIYMGSKTYAPTAASQGKYFVKTKKVISYKYVSASKLLPGDLIYMSKGKNGRYKNIYHTGIYIGNGKIIHANGSYVAITNYTKYKPYISIIARPVK